MKILTTNYTNRKEINMKRKLLVSLLLLCAAIILMITAVRYFFLYLATNDFAGSVMFYAWAGLGAFYGALKCKGAEVQGRKTTTNYTNFTN